MLLYIAAGRRLAQTAGTLLPESQEDPHHSLTSTSNKWTSFKSYVSRFRESISTAGERC